MPRACVFLSSRMNMPSPRFRTLLVMIVCIGILLASSLDIERRYIYSTEETTYPLSWERTDDGYRSSVKIALQQERDAFFLSFAKTFEAKDEHDIEIDWSIDGKNIHTHVDLEGDERFLLDDRYFVEPVLASPAKHIFVTLSINRRDEIKLPENIVFSALSSNEFSYSASFRLPALRAVRADISGVSIVSRAEWGADEEFRYSDSEAWKSIIERRESREPTTAQKAQAEKNRAIHRYLETNFPQEYALVENRQEADSGRPLAWNAQTTRYVKRLVIHHTAENLLDTRTDEEIIRAIYYYHAIVR